MTAARDLFFSPTFSASLSLPGEAIHSDNLDKSLPGMSGSPWACGRARHTPPHFPVASGVPASPASWLCPSLGHSRSSSFASSSSSLLLTPPLGATMASFVGLGQRPQLSPQSSTRSFSALSGSEYMGEFMKKAERKYVLLRDPKGWYYNVPESALETSPEVAPRALPPARSPVSTPCTPLLPSSSLPPSPPLPQVAVSPLNGGDAFGLGLGLGLHISVTDKAASWPWSSSASGTLSRSSGSSSNKSTHSPHKEVSHSPLWDAAGLPYSPRNSARPSGLEVGLQLVKSWAPLPAASSRSSTLAPSQPRVQGSDLSRLCSPVRPQALLLQPDLPSLPLQVPSAFELLKEPIVPHAPIAHSVPLPRVSCYDPNDEIFRPTTRTVRAAVIRSKFAGFVPTHRLGGGAQGRVVRIEHCGTGNVYALKVVHKGLAAARKFSRKNFLIERNVMLAVNESETAGRFLMSMFMCWEDVQRDLVYFVMPLCSTDLATALLKKEDIPMRDRYLWCKELLCAMVHLYYLGILHMDIKPTNILISHSGNAVLTDFGNAKEVPMYDYATWKGYSRDGTYCYMAPEMVSADAHTVGYGTGVDVWSMGLVLMEIIGFCDGPFFHQRTLEGVQWEHADSGRLPIDPDKFLCSEEKFWEILPAMLQVNPKKRITVRQLEDKYVRSEDWASVRDGSAIHGWLPDAKLPATDVEDATHFLDFSAYSNPGPRYGIDPSQFEYCAPGIS